MIAPCPWCKQSETCILGAADLHYIHCICDGCSADGPLRPTEAEAIAAWNKVAEKMARHDPMRVALEKAAEALDLVAFSEPVALGEVANLARECRAALKEAGNA